MATKKVVRKKKVTPKPAPTPAPARKRKVNPYMEAAKAVGRCATKGQELRARKDRLALAVKKTDQAIEDNDKLHEKALAYLQAETDELKKQAALKTSAAEIPVVTAEKKKSKAIEPEVLPDEPEEELEDEEEEEEEEDDDEEGDDDDDEEEEDDDLEEDDLDEDDDEEED